MRRAESNEAFLRTIIVVRIVWIERYAESSAVEPRRIRHHQNKPQGIPIGLSDGINVDVAGRIACIHYPATQLQKRRRGRHTASLNEQPVVLICHGILRRERLQRAEEGL